MWLFSSYYDVELFIRPVYITALWKTVETTKQGIILDNLTLFPHRKFMDIISHTT